MKLPRRQLLQALAAGTLYPLAAGRVSAAATGSVLQPGIQLWSVRREVAADPAAALQAIASFGYRKVETAGTGGLSASEFRRLLDQNALDCVSAHQSFDENNLQPTFDEANILGARYTASGLLRPGTGEQPLLADGSRRGMATMTADDAKRIAALCNRIGEAAAREGLRYCYHNHYFELVELEDGQTGLEIMLAETDPALVTFEIDCGWTYVAGRSNVDFLQRYSDRIPMLHIKDFLPLEADQTSTAERRSTELGNGEMDYAPIIDAALAAGVEHFLVEQEDPFTGLAPMQAAEANYTTLSRWLSNA